MTEHDRTRGSAAGKRKCRAYFCLGVGLESTGCNVTLSIEIMASIGLMVEARKRHSPVRAAPAAVYSTSSSRFGDDVYEGAALAYQMPSDASRFGPEGIISMSTAVEPESDCS